MLTYFFEHRMKPLADYDASKGTDASATKAQQGVFVLDYSSVTEAQMKEAVPRIGKALYA